MKIVIISLIVMAILGGVFVTGKSGNTSSGSTSQSAVSMQQINSDIAGGGTMIDVRTPAEYAGGHIDGSVNLPLQNIQSGTLPQVAKDKPVYIYCKSGNRSKQATNALKAAGYQTIVDLGAITSVQSLGGNVKS